MPEGSQPGPSLRLGLGSYGLRWTVRDKAPAAACRLLISTAAELGLDLLQIADNVALLELDAPQRRAVKALADEAGVHLEVGLGTYAAADFRRMVRLAESFGSRHIRLVGKDPVRLAALLARIGSDVAKWGGGVVVENYFPVPTDRLLETLHGAPFFVGTCADTANSIPAGEWPSLTLKKLLPLASYVHIKDFHFVPGPDAIGWSLMGTPLGTGQQDVAGIVRATRAAPRHPDLIIEHWLPRARDRRTTSEAELDWLRRGVAMLRGLSGAGRLASR